MRRAACAQRMMVSGALRATAWLFVTVAAHALWRRLAVHSVLFGAVAALSLAFHAAPSSSARVARADKAAAHAAFVYVVAADARRALADAPWLLAFPAAVLACWFAQGLDARWRVPLHAAVHVFAAMGMHAYLARLYRQLP